MTSIRAALFTDSDVFAGTERHILDLGCGLREEGIDVRIACPTPSVLAEKIGGRLPILAIPKGGLIDAPAIRMLVSALKSDAVNIIHAHNGRTALSAAIAVRLAGKGHCILTQHFLEPGYLSCRRLHAPLKRAAHRWVDSKTSHFIAISEAVRAAMMCRGEAASEAITVIPNGIPRPNIEALRDPGAVRAEFGMDSDAPLVVCVARLEKEKDVSTLIGAMAAVCAKVPKARCIIAGEGAEREALEKQITETRLDMHVSLPGFRSDAFDLIHAADVFVLPSLAEPFGLVLVEAMALGKPLIATNVGGPCEIVVDGETGTLVPPATPHALAEAILQLLADRGLRERMGLAGLQRYGERFSLQRMTRAIAAVYENVLRPNKSSKTARGAMQKTAESYLSSTG